MDTMTITKTIGAFCGALLIFMLGNYVASNIYQVGLDETAHDGEHVQGYAIEVASAEPEEASDEPEIPFEEIYASADAAAGEGLWRQCASCHNLDGSNATGPYLNGVVDREKHQVDGLRLFRGAARPRRARGRPRTSPPSSSRPRTTRRAPRWPIAAWAT